MKHLLLALLLCLPLAASPSDAQDVTVQRVPAPGGVVDTRLAGLIIGYQSISYVVSMARGQALSVALTASNNATYFNVYGPGSGPGGQALLNSGTTRPANRGQITAQRGGDYTINVYLTREAARRLETSLFGLSVAVRGSAATDRPPRPEQPILRPEAGPDYWRVAVGTGRHLNLRGGPGTGYAVITQVRHGTTLRNRGCQTAGRERWCEVETLDASRIRAFASAQFLEASAGAGHLPESPGARPPVASPPAAGHLPGAPSADRTERVRFPPGATGTVLRDSLGNGGTVTYILGVRAGQMLELSLNADSQSIRFTVLRPGGQVLFDSAQGGAYYRGQTFENGDHRIRVYSTQPRAGAFSLNLSVF